MDANELLAKVNEAIEMAAEATGREFKAITADQVVKFCVQAQKQRWSTMNYGKEQREKIKLLKEKAEKGELSEAQMAALREVGLLD